MPTETIRFTAIPTGSYVLVADGHYNVLIRPITPVALRLHVGQSAPAANTTHYIPMTGAGVSLSDLEGGDKVYLRGEEAGGEVVVVRGG